MTLAPGEQPSAWQPSAPLGRLARWALGLWAGLALLLWAGSALFGSGDGGPLAQARRLVALAGPGLLFLLAPALVMPGLMMLLRRPWQLGLEYALVLGLAAQIFFALVFTGLAMLALVQGEDPWERMPYVYPPYLERFRDAHPGIGLTTLNRVSEVRLWADGQTMRADGRDIADAQVRLARCTTPPNAAELAGLVLPPGARCAAALSVRRGKVQRVSWQFEMDAATPVAALEQHFEAWAKAQGAGEARFSGGGHYQFSAERGTQKWQVQILRDKGAPVRLVVPQGGVHPPWADDSGE